MRINKVIALLLSFGMIFAGETAAINANCSDKIDISDIVIPTIDYDAIKEKSYKFTLKSDGTYEISKYIYEIPETGFLPGGDLELPSAYKGKPVTSIAPSAFQTNNANHITGTLTIPSSITSIGEWAFWMCDFTNCVIPSSVTSIGRQAFYETPWLDNMRKQNPLVIVNNILIDAQAASGDIVVPNGVKEICGYAFSENTSVTGVTLPESVKTIGKYAFKNCESLAKINLPNGITEIGEWAFGGCKKLGGTLVIPSGLKTINDFAFINCTGFTKIVIPSGVTEIGINAFRNCSSVESVSIPNTVTAIGQGAFSENHSLTDIVIPESVKSIGEKCFNYCYELNSIKILGPECEIYDESDTIYLSADVLGYENSTAQSYAEKYGRGFQNLNLSTKLGDINGDGVVDSSDATLALREYTLLLSGENGTFSESWKIAADVNSDGTIDASDATKILRYYTEALSLTSGTMPDMDKWIKKQEAV